MLKKILSVIAYIALFTFSTVVFTYFMFPLDKVRGYIETKVNASPKYRLEIDSMERDGLGTMVLSDVTIGVNKKLFKRKSAAPPVPAPETTAPDTNAEAVPEVVEEFSYVDIDEIIIDFSLLQFVDPRHITFSLSLQLLGGAIEDAQIELIQHEGKTKTALDFPVIKELDLGETEFFASIFSAILPSMNSDQVTGYLETGSVKMEPQLEDEVSYYTGLIDIELTEIIALAPVLVQRLKRTNQTVELPLTDLKLGRCIFQIRMDRKDRVEELDKVKTKHDQASVVLFEKGECKGESLDYYIAENSFILFPPKAAFSKGKMDLWTKMAFNPDYFEEERIVDGKSVAHNKEMGQGLEFDRRWQKSQDVDGFYWMHCKGSLGKPKCRRGLPKAEKTRKKALAKIEKAKKKKKEAAKKKKKEAEKKRKKKEKEASGKDDRKKAADKRREEARKRAEEMRKKREEEGRKRPTLMDLRTPSGPDSEEVEPADDEGIGDDEPLEDEPLEDEPLEDEPLEDEPLDEEGDELPSDDEESEQQPDAVSQPDVNPDDPGSGESDDEGPLDPHEPTLVPFP